MSASFFFFREKKVQRPRENATFSARQKKNVIINRVFYRKSLNGSTFKASLGTLFLITARTVTSPMKLIQSLERAADRGTGARFSIRGGWALFFEIFFRIFFFHSVLTEGCRRRALPRVGALTCSLWRRSMGRSLLAAHCHPAAGGSACSTWSRPPWSKTNHSPSVHVGEQSSLVAVHVSLFTLPKKKRVFRTIALIACRTRRCASRSHPSLARPAGPHLPPSRVRSRTPFSLCSLFHFSFPRRFFPRSASFWSVHALQRSRRFLVLFFWNFYYYIFFNRFIQLIAVRTLCASQSNQCLKNKQKTVPFLQISECLPVNCYHHRLVTLIAFGE